MYFDKIWAFPCSVAFSYFCFVLSGTFVIKVCFCFWYSASSGDNSFGFTTGTTGCSSLTISVLFGAGVSGILGIILSLKKCM